MNATKPWVVQFAPSLILVVAPWRSLPQSLYCFDATIGEGIDEVLFPEDGWDDRVQAA